MLEIVDLELSFPGFSLKADLSIETSQRVAILGPSGAGKSTLLSAIAGFLSPESGGIRLDGTDITTKPPGERGLAMVFQDQNLFPHMTAFENVGLALSPRLRLSSAQIGDVNEALVNVGLQNMGARKPGELSGGQQARVTLARTLLQRASYLLLDEPFAALGPGLRIEMLELIARLCSETAMGLLMVTHDPSDARVLCDQTIVVADGIALPPQSTQHVVDHPNAALAKYLGIS